MQIWKAVKAALWPPMSFNDFLTMIGLLICVAIFLLLAGLGNGR